MLLSRAQSPVTLEHNFYSQTNPSTGQTVSKSKTFLGVLKVNTC